MSDASNDAKTSPPTPGLNSSLLSDVLKFLPIVFIILGFLGTALAAGFVGGIGAYKLWLEVTQKDEVAKGSYVLKKDIQGIYLRKEARAQLDNLIKTKQADEAWLLESKTFVAGLQCDPKNAIGVQSQELPERPVQTWCSDASPLALIFYAQSEGTLDVQTKRTLGVLSGVQRLYNSTPE